MFKFLKRSTLDPLSVTMVGVKLADRVLVIGCRDPRLIAALAIKAGLTGRACAVDAFEAVVREAERIALKEGALVEFSTACLATLPFDAGAFDVVVLRDVMRAAAHERSAGPRLRRRRERARAAAGRPLHGDRQRRRGGCLAACFGPKRTRRRHSRGRPLHAS